MIHPALAAALTPEKMETQALPEKEPLARVEYRSIPLRGTEPRDATALGLKQDTKPTGTTLPSEQDSDSRETESQTAAREGQPQNRFNHSFSGRENEFEHHSEEARDEQPELSMLASDSAKSIPQKTTLDNVDNSQRHRQRPTPLTDTGVIVQKKPSLDVTNNATTTGFWKGMIERIKHSINRVTIPKRIETTERETSGGNGERIEQEDSYFESDVNQMVSNIIRKIQMRSNDARAHREMSQRGQHWSAGDKVPRQRNHLDNNDMLVVRTKVLIDPQALAEALCESAQKFMLSKRRKLSSQSESNLLLAVHTRLAEELRHLNGV